MKELYFRFEILKRENEVYCFNIVKENISCMGDNFIGNFYKYIKEFSLERFNKKIEDLAIGGLVEGEEDSTSAETFVFNKPIFKKIIKNKEDDKLASFAINKFSKDLNDIYQNNFENKEILEIKVCYDEQQKEFKFSKEIISLFDKDINNFYVLYSYIISLLQDICTNEFVMHVSLFILDTNMNKYSIFNAFTYIIDFALSRIDSKLKIEYLDYLTKIYEELFNLVFYKPVEKGHEHNYILYQSNIEKITI